MAGLYGNARPWPQIQRNKVVSNIPQLPGKGKFVEARVNGGMITELDAADIPLGAMQLAQNVRVRLDKTQRRPGTSLLEPTKPNSLPVIGLFYHKESNGDDFYFRFTASTIHHRTATWDAVTAAAAVKATGTLTATANFANGETVTIGTKVYTFQTVLTNVDGNVFIGVSLTASLLNLSDAIDLSGVAGTQYAAAMTAHPTVSSTASGATTMDVEADAAGLAGNSIALDETAANAEWDDTHLTGGLAAGALTGSASDYPQAATVLDHFVFANNGADVLHEIDTSTMKYQPLGNAPEYRFVTGFYNRVFAANLGINASQIGWSGDDNVTEWDPLVDETAGNTPLLESPGDLGDDISGIFGFTNVLVVLRERSIWLGTKQPIPTFPVAFHCAFPGVGCDAPYSAKITVNGLTWFDRRSGTVWHYTPGQAPEPIGRPVETELAESIDDEDLIFAGYNPTESEYTVCIPVPSTARVICWTYNFRTQAWSKDTYEGISCISDADVGEASLTIDELVGTIDGLTGDIDSLGRTQDIMPLRQFGRKDGEILIEDPEETDDVDYLSGGDGDFETVLVSKAFTFPTDDMYVAELRIELQIVKAGTITLSYSKTGTREITFTAQKSRTFTGADLEKNRIFTWTRQVKCRRYSWILATTDCDFKILAYEVHTYKSGESASANDS